jgi:hypothetical protein
MNSETQFRPPYTVDAPRTAPAEQKQTPVSVGNWLITFLLLAIPLVNIVLLCVWSFSERLNPSKRNYCRAALIVQILLLAACVSAVCVIVMMNIYIL